MRVALAFVLGALVAAGVAVYVVKKDRVPPAVPQQQAAVTAPEPARPLTAEPQAEAPVEAPAPSVPAKAPRPRASKPAPAPPVETPAAAEPAAPVQQQASNIPAPTPATAVEPQPLARPVTPDPPPPPPKPEPKSVTIPAGTLLHVRLAEPLSSDKNKNGDAFGATLDQPLVVDGFVIAERGARLEGRVEGAEEAGRVKGVAYLALQLTRLHTADGQRVAVSTDRFEKKGETSTGNDAAKVGTGAAVGAIIGAIAGGGKGAAIGAGAGGAAGTGVVLATRGKPAEFKVETRISFRLNQPLTLTERIR